MGNFWKLIGAAALAAGTAGAAHATVDITKMTCADYSKLSEVEELSVSGELLAWIADAANAEAAGSLVAKYGTPSDSTKWRPETMHIEIEGHCIDAPGNMTVIERLKEHS